MIDGLNFIRENNRIEGIHREPTKAEIVEFERFMKLREVTVEDLERFVRVYQPNAILRDKAGLDVRVGNHVPPRGGSHMAATLAKLLERAGRIPCDAYTTHIEYETLHPFTDGNGRSGRMLWAWQMRDFPLGFLHHFYYQTLQNRAK